MQVADQLPQLLILLRLAQLFILPGTFATATAAQVMGQAACPIETSLLLRRLRMLWLVELGRGFGTWHLQASMRVAAAKLDAQIMEIPPSYIPCGYLSTLSGVYLNCRW